MVPSCIRSHGNFSILALTSHLVLWLAGCCLTDLSLAFDKPFSSRLGGAALLIYLTLQSYLDTEPGKLPVRQNLGDLIVLGRCTLYHKPSSPDIGFSSPG